MPKTIRILLMMLLALSAPATLVACGDDDDSPADAGDGDSGDGDSGDGDSGDGDSGDGDSGDGDSGDGDSGDGDAGDGDAGDGDAGDGDEGDGDAGDGDGSDACDLDAATEEVDIPQPTGDMTLTSGKVWVLKAGVTYVEDGDTLKIEPCTKIIGDARDSTLVVSRGGKIMAMGEPDAPIVFTSALEAGDRQVGDWAGVVLLGKAPNFKGTENNIEGLATDPKNQHGGDVEDDNSGVMKYVRIEFSGFELSKDNEINGLTFGSVGSKTEIHHIMVNTTQDDCYEWFGGTVNVHHLICNNGGDDMFDADQGYKGKMEYLFGRQVDVSSEDPNGFEMDSDKSTTDEPRTFVQPSHATLCGIDADNSYGMVLRENLTGELDDIAVTGFKFGLDARSETEADDFGTEADPNVTIANSSVWGNSGGLSDPADDNDRDFDEQMWFDMGDSNDEPDPGPYDADDCGAEDGPNDKVMDSKIGAFADGVDDWDWDGMWIDWTTDL